MFRINGCLHCSKMNHSQETAPKLPPLPPSSDAAFVILHGMFECDFDGSRHPINHISGDLRQHVKPGDPGEIRGAISSTMVVSGKEGSNVPVLLAADSQFGVVFNPEKIHVPHGNFEGGYSWGTVLETEIPKDGFEYNDYGVKTESSKYKEKVGMPLNHQQGYAGFATNYARFKDDTKTDGPPSLNTFYSNLWGKFHKKPKPTNKDTYRVRCGGTGVMATNELLVFQKGDQNPVEGLFIDVTTNLNMKQVAIVSDSLAKNPHLKLYVYDRNQKDHIVRVCDNTKGCDLLRQGIDYVNSRAYIQELKLLVQDRMAIAPPRKHSCTIS